MTFWKEFRKISAKTPETLSELFLENYPREHGWAYNSKHLKPSGWHFSRLLNGLFSGTPAIAETAPLKRPIKRSMTEDSHAYRSALWSFGVKFDLKFEVSAGKTLVKLGEDFFTCHESIRKFEANFGANLETISETSLQISRLFAETSFSRRTM